MRSFIAISIPDDVRADIDEISNRLREDAPPARWVPASNIHVTLKFLDEITEDQVAPLAGAIRMASKDVAPFAIRLGGFGVFPNTHRARVFWLGIEDGFETLRHLAHAIDLEANHLGFHKEKRKFSAHLTLARMREPAPADPLLAAAAEIPYLSKPIPVGEIHLMRSVLSPKGAEYSVLKSVALKKT